MGMKFPRHCVGISFPHHYMGIEFPQNGMGMEFPQTIRRNCILFIILPPGHPPNRKSSCDAKTTLNPTPTKLDKTTLTTKCV